MYFITCGDEIPRLPAVPPPWAPTVELTDVLLKSSPSPSARKGSRELVAIIWAKHLPLRKFGQSLRQACKSSAGRDDSVPFDTALTVGAAGSKSLVQPVYSQPLRIQEEKAVQVNRNLTPDRGQLQWQGVGRLFPDRKKNRPPQVETA